jgi:predicted DNA-binding transcriptional regulator YafY
MWDCFLARGDWPVSLLLLLQRRQRLTAAEVAAELEVSERTARRDLEALCAAGIPLYSERGRGGGWRLLGGARTDLSGLNAAEARALFLVAGPTAAATPEPKSALRKLVRALPEPLQDRAEASAAAVVIDPGGWGQTRRARRPAQLDSLQAAVVEGEQVRLHYTGRDGHSTARLMHPLGTVQKGTVWYLVAATDDGLRTFRVSRVRSVERTGHAAVRPEGFDLADAWSKVVEEVDELRSPAAVLVAAEPSAVDVLRWMFERQADVRAPRPDGRLLVERGSMSWSRSSQASAAGSRSSTRSRLDASSPDSRESSSPSTGTLPALRSSERSGCPITHAHRVTTHLGGLASAVAVASLALGRLNDEGEQAAQSRPPWPDVRRPDDRRRSTKRSAGEGKRRRVSEADQRTHVGGRLNDLSPDEQSQGAPARNKRHQCGRNEAEGMKRPLLGRRYLHSRRPDPAGATVLFRIVSPPVYSAWTTPMR